MNSMTTNDVQDQTTTQSLCLTIGGTKKAFSSDTFLDPRKMDELREEIANSSAQVKVFLRTVPAWPPKERFLVLSFLATLKGDIRFFVGKNEPTHDNLFGAVLTLPSDAVDGNQVEPMKRMWIEAAVVCQPSSLDGAADQIMTRLRKLGVKGVTRAKLVSEASKLRELIQRQTQIAKFEGTKICDVFSDAPVHSQATIPTGWKLTTEGIEHLDGRMPLVSSPVLVVGRQFDIESKAVSLELAWLQEGVWHRHRLARENAANSPTITKELAAFGVPVTSNNARTLVQFLSDYEAANLAHIPRQSVSHQLGWQVANGSSGFLLGMSFISTSEQTSEVAFEGRDDGDNEIAKGFRVGGDLGKWLQAIKQLRSKPSARLVLYAGFASPLLHLFNTPGICLDIAGQTTTGKTTMLRAVASIWGDPDDSKPDSLLKSWDSTQVFRERAPAVLNSLPLILDDTKLANNPEDVARTVYSFAAGRGRGRGSVKGVASTQTWKNMLITSGEQPLTSFSNDGGTRARVLSLWGSPFGATDTLTGNSVRRLNRRILENYGHAGMAFVTYLVNNQDLWDGWRATCDRHTETYQTRAGENQFAARMAPMMAVICLAAELAHEALKMPWKYADPILPVWDELTRNSQDANRPLAALRYVKDWANAHQEEFSGRGSTHSQPHGGWAGRWDSVPVSQRETRRSTWIGFFPNRLERLLRDGGFEAEAILRAWDDNEWLEKSRDSNGTRRNIRARLAGESVRLTAITRRAWDQADQA